MFARSRAAIVTLTLSSAVVIVATSSVDAAGSGQVRPAAATWIQQHPTNAPNARIAPSMAFSLKQGIVLCCGASQKGKAYSDLWRWDGEAANWAEITPQTSPPARFGASMAYDFNHDQLVLFGGSHGTGSLGDTWVSDGKKWSKVAKNGTHPSPRLYGSMYWDNTTLTLLLFGGRADPAKEKFLNDTWSWDGTRWKRLSPANSPEPRAEAPMTILSEGGLLLFSGQDATHAFDDTWTWNGTTWRKMSPMASPASGVGGALAFDDQLGGPVLFTGTQSGVEMWLWTGTTWTKQTMSGSPSGRSLFGYAYDAQWSDLVLFGGSVKGKANGETWTGS